jgi:hypothetical protein
MVPGVQYRPRGKNGLTLMRSSKHVQSLMQAVLTAPRSVGNPIRRGKGGSAGLFEWMAVKHPHIYMSLLIEILPLTVADQEQANERVNAHERPTEIIASMQYLLQAIVTAPQSVGNPARRGKGGLAGYMEWLAVKYPRIYASLLVKFKPLLLAEQEYAAECANVSELLKERLDRMIKSIEATEALGIGPDGPVDQPSTTNQVP